MKSYDHIRDCHDKLSRFQHISKKLCDISEKLIDDIWRQKSKFEPDTNIESSIANLKEFIRSNKQFITESAIPSHLYSKRDNPSKVATSANRNTPTHSKDIWNDSVSIFHDTKFDSVISASSSHNSDALKATGVHNFNGIVGDKVSLQQKRIEANSPSYPSSLDSSLISLDRISPNDTNCPERESFPDYLNDYLLE